jgi:hypothetical protein
LWLASGTAEPPAVDQRLSVEERNHSVRAQVFDRIRERNPALLRYNEGIGHIITMCLHERPQDRPEHADDLLRLLDDFEAMQGRRPSGVPRPLADEAEALVKTVKGLDQRDPLFTALVSRDLTYLLRRLRDVVSGGRAEITGTRGDIIVSLLTYLSALAPHDLYCTCTTIGYWQDQNLGADGRFLCANKLLALRGVRIRRLFVLAESEVKSQLFNQVIAAQARIVRELADLGLVTSGRRLNGEGYYVGVIRLPEPERQELLQDGYHVGFIQKQDQSISLSFQQDSCDVIRKVFVWRTEGSPAVANKHVLMERYLERSDPVESLVSA